MSKKLHYIIISSIFLVETALVILVFLNLFSNTTSVPAYNTNGESYISTSTYWYSAFSCNLENYLWLVIISFIALGVSVATMITSIFFNKKDYNIVTYVYAFIAICLFASMFITTKTAPVKLA